MDGMQAPTSLDSLRSAVGRRPVARSLVQYTAMYVCDARVPEVPIGTYVRTCHREADRHKYRDRH
jgi:hypothetical protein